MFSSVAPAGTSDIATRVGPPSLDICLYFTHGNSYTFKMTATPKSRLTFRTLLSRPRP